MDIGTLAGRLELEDAFSSTLQYATAMVKQFGNEFGGAAGSVTIAAASVAAAVGAVAAATYSLAKQAAKVGDELSDFSIKTGLAIEKVGPLDFAAKAAGGSLDQLNSILMRMTMRQMTDSTGRFSSALHDLGLNAASFNKMPMDEKITALSKGFHEAEARGKGMSDAIALFGRSGANLLPMLDKLTPELIELAKRNAMIWTPERVQQAQEFNIAASEITQTIGSLSTRIGAELLPPLSTLMKQLAESEGLINSVVWVFEKATHGVGYFIYGLGALVTAQAAVEEAWRQMAKAILASTDLILRALQDVAAVQLLIDPTNTAVAKIVIALGDAREKLKGFGTEFDASQKGLVDGLLKTGMGLATLGTGFINVGTNAGGAKKPLHDIATELGGIDKEGEKARKQWHDLIVAGGTYTAILGAVSSATRNLVPLLVPPWRELNDELHQVIVSGSTYVEILGVVSRVSRSLLPDLVPPWKSLDTELSTTAQIVDYLGHDGLPNLVANLEEVPGAFDHIIGALDEFAAVFTSFQFSNDAWLRAFSQDVAALVGIFKQVRAQIEATKTAEGVLVGGTSFKKDKLGGAMTLAAGGAGAIGAIQSGNIEGGAMAGAEMGLGVATMTGMTVAAGAATMGIGAAVVGGIALYKHLAKKEGRDMVLEYAKNFGDIDKMHADLVNKFGEKGEKMWHALADVGRHNTDQAKAAIQAVENELAKLQTAIDEASQAWSDMGSEISAFGMTVPKDLQKIAQKIIEIGSMDDIGKMTDAVKKFQKQLEDTQAFQTVEQEMKDVGLTADDMNAKFHQMAAEEAARTMAKQWKDLAPYVKDVNVLAGKFHDQILQMVVDAKNYGIAIPRLMQPIIQSLIDQGQLVDENGVKLTDLVGMHFEDDPLIEGLDALNTTLQEIETILKDRLPAAFKDMSDAGVRSAEEVAASMSGLRLFTYRSSQAATGHASGGIVYAESGANILPFRPRGTDTVPAMLTPGERVLTVDENRQYEQGRDQDINVTLMMDSDVLLKHVVRARKRLG